MTVDDPSLHFDRSHGVGLGSPNILIGIWTKCNVLACLDYIVVPLGFSSCGHSTNVRCDILEGRLFNLAFSFVEFDVRRCYVLTMKVSTKQPTEEFDKLGLTCPDEKCILNVENDPEDILLYILVTFFGPVLLNLGIKFNAISIVAMLLPVFGWVKSSEIRPIEQLGITSLTTVIFPFTEIYYRNAGYFNNYIEINVLNVETK
ncbi:hypothetical protein OUZ56_020378 [Daphnia magna]|uniref:Uncharacterized protein n=1 Tax=Daphnia magna TaxID=35525 RepID=A0ABQ9ZEB7_9CRUS|nr:hypothetical protein OUZ56_020378 [Daphnia magna]